MGGLSGEAGSRGGASRRSWGVCCWSHLVGLPINPESPRTGWSLLPRELDGATAGLRPQVGRDGLTLAQEVLRAGTGCPGPGKVNFQCGGDRPPACERPPNLDSCPEASSTGPPSPPSVSLSPEWLDTPGPVPAAEGENSTGPRTPLDASPPECEPLLGAVIPLQDEAPGVDSEDSECPICTEPYGPREHCLTLLNCGHGLCTGCLHQLLGATPSTDLGRVRCPLCRQNTPMIEWEICRLQEELLQADGPQPPPPAAPPLLPRRGHGPWAALEHRYQLRFLAGPVGGQGCLPFLPCSPCLGARLWALRERGPCARRLALLGLLGLELLGLLLAVTPLTLLGLLFVLLDRASR